MDTSCATRILQALALAALAGCAAVRDDAPPRTLSAHAVRVGELERAFWACDYVATTQGVLATPVAACRYATEELKQQKFGGSFAQLLEWWRANKAAEHRRLARLEGQ